MIHRSNPGPVIPPANLIGARHLWGLGCLRLESVVSGDARGCSLSLLLGLLDHECKVLLGETALEIGDGDARSASSFL